MKKILIAVLVLGVISSLLMIRFYFASVTIYQEFVNEKTLAYLNTLSSMENLPQWTTMHGLWIDLQIDYIIRFVFMIVITIVIIGLIYTTKRSAIFLYIALALSFVTSASMILYFLASSDIYNEYVSGEIIRLVNLHNVGGLLATASCELEWVITAVDFILRIIFMVFITVVLVKCILKKEKLVVPLN